MRFKRMSEIYSRLVDHTITNTKEINDFSVGSAIRAIYEAVSIQIEQFYVMTRENMQEAIERGVHDSFGFTGKPSTRAFGVMQIAFHNATQHDILVSRGSRFSSSLPQYSQVYETMVDYVIPKGSIVAEVEVHCLTPGAVGNVPAGAIDVMHSPVANIRQVTNLQAFQTGQDAEPKEEIRARFRSFIKSLSRATVPAIEYGVRSVQEVSGVWIDEQTGRINIYAHDRNGNLSEAVKAKIMSTMSEYKPAGIPVYVYPVTRRAIDINVEVTLTNKDAITDKFTAKIAGEVARYLNNMQTGQHLVLSDLASVIKYIDRQLIYDVRFKNLDSNVTLQGYEIIRAGAITVNLK